MVDWGAVSSWDGDYYNCPQDVLLRPSQKAAEKDEDGISPSGGLLHRFNLPAVRLSAAQAAQAPPPAVITAMFGHCLETSTALATRAF
jgi:hypothetical protein